MEFLGPKVDRGIAFEAAGVFLGDDRSMVQC
jgi:hypothetical protein